MMNCSLPEQNDTSDSFRRLESKRFVSNRLKIQITNPKSSLHI